MEKYQLIYHNLKTEILDGRYSLNHRFPTEPDLAKAFNVARLTLRKAMKLLENDGLIERRPGQGTFVKTLSLHGKKKILAIVHEFCGDFSSPRHSILPGVEEACRDYNLELVRASSEQIICGQCHVQKENFIGIVLPDEYTLQSPEFIFAKSTNLPIVLPHDTSYEQKNQLDCAIISRYDDGILLVLRHLLGMGHRRILTLNREGQNLMVRRVKIADYRAFLRKYNADDSVDLIRSALWNDPASINKALEPIFSANPPTAIVCYSDFLAMRVYSVLKKHNILIPQDVAVTGFGGYPGCELFDPPLTTVDQHYHQRGQMAVKLLLESANWYPHKPPFFRMLSTLAVRKSSDKFVYN